MISLTYTMLTNAIKKDYDQQSFSLQSVAPSFKPSSIHTTLKKDIKLQLHLENTDLCQGQKKFGR